MLRPAVFLLALLVAAPAVAQSDAPTLPDAPQGIDPNGTRLFLSPTARTMPQGQGRLSSYMVFFPSLAYGFTDWLDASAGVSLLPGSTTQVVTVNLKAQAYDGEAVDVAVGTLFGTPVGEGTGDGFGGTAYGLVTVGSERQAFTVGAYVAYAGIDATSTFCDGNVCETEDNFDFAVAEGAVVVLGGEVQTSNTTKLITENYVGFGEGGAGGVVSGGVRFFSEQIAVDLALARPFPYGNETGGLPFIPYLAFAYNFGR
jgi:hypothetical protein